MVGAAYTGAGGCRQFEREFESSVGLMPSLPHKSPGALAISAMFPTALIRARGS